MGPPVKPFRYGLDPLCLTAVVLYGVNRWLCHGHLHSEFLRDHFNDLLTVAAALPPVLWIHRVLGTRTHDDPPGPGEVALHVVVWSLVCEGIGPLLLGHGTADWLDVAAYAVGGCAALLIWNLRSPGTCEAA